MPNYLLFVDDSGTREYDPQRVYGTTGRSRYFVYGALLGEADRLARLAEHIAELKRHLFETDAVEVKSNWLRIPHERIRRYVTPFGVSEKTVDDLSDGCHQLIRDAQVELLASVVDKMHMQEDYATPWYPPTVAYEILLQRAVQAVPAGSSLAVTVDDISGKTPKHNSYKDLLQRHHSTLRARGSSLQRSISFAPLSGPVRFQLSHHSHLLQAADLVAYNVHRQFREHGQDWESKPLEGGTLPMYPYFKRICSKFRTDGTTGRVQGFGIAKFPLRKRVNWTVVSQKGEKNDAAP